MNRGERKAARVATAISSQNRSAEAKGLVGKGTVTVESVRLIKDPSTVFEVP